MVTGIDKIQKHESFTESYVDRKSFNKDTDEVILLLKQFNSISKKLKKKGLKHKVIFT